MRLLFDQNLSRKLVEKLVDLFPNCSHVQFHDLADKTDTEIWEFANNNGFCITHRNRKSMDGDSRLLEKDYHLQIILLYMKR